MLRTAVYCVIGAAFGYLVALMLQDPPEFVRDMAKGGALSGVLASLQRPRKTTPAQTRRTPVQNRDSQA
jgi:hypothetical protein